MTSRLIAVLIAFIALPQYVYASDPLGVLVVLGFYILLFFILSLVFFILSIVISKNKKIILVLHFISIILYFILPKSAVQIWDVQSVPNYPDLEYILAYSLILTSIIFCFSIILRLSSKFHGR